MFLVGVSDQVRRLDETPRGARSETALALRVLAADCLPKTRGLARQELAQNLVPSGYRLASQIATRPNECLPLLNF